MNICITMHAQSCLFVILYVIARQVPLSLGFIRQEYWSGLPFPIPGDLPNPGTELVTPALAGGFFTTEPPGNTCITICIYKYDYICIKL